MTNRINNKYEYRSGLLNSLKVQHTASDVRNEDEYRKKVLNGLGVEYTDDDINQKNLYRAKVVEGLASSGGGGGSSDLLKIATVTIVNNSTSGWGLSGGITDGNNSTKGFGFLVLTDKLYYEISTYEGLPRQSTKELQAILMPQNGVMGAEYTVVGNGTPTVTVAGNAEYIVEEEIGMVYITGDCTITIS